MTETAAPIPPLDSRPPSTDGWKRKLTRGERRALVEALQAAFPSLEDVRQLVAGAVDEPFDEIAPPNQRLGSVLREIVKAFEARGTRADLLAEARRLRPQNTQLLYVLDTIERNDDIEDFRQGQSVLLRTLLEPKIFAAICAGCFVVAGLSLLSVWLAHNTAPIYVDARVIVHALAFQHVADDTTLEAEGSPFLNHTEADGLVVSSFSSIRAALGSVRIDPGPQSPNESLTVPAMLFGDHPLAKVTVEALARPGTVQLQSVQPPSDGRVRVSTHGWTVPGLTVAVAGGSSLLMVGAPDVTLECQLCAFERSGERVSGLRVLTAEIRGLENAPLVITGSSDRIALHVSLGPKGLGAETVFGKELSFCEASAPPMPSSVHAARVTFPKASWLDGANDVVLNGHESLRLDADGPLTMSDFTIVTLPHTGSDPDAYGIQLNIRGLVNRLATAADCTSAPVGRMPSRVAVLQRSPAAYWFAAGLGVAALVALVCLGAWRLRQVGDVTA